MKIYLLAISLLISQLVCAQGQNFSQYDHLNLLMQTGLYDKVLSESLSYLNTHPDDGDVRLLLAKVYLQQNKPLLARQELQNILIHYPAYTDASLILARIDCSAGAYQEASDTIALALIYNPADANLIREEHYIFSLQYPSKLPSIPIKMKSFQRIKKLRVYKTPTKEPIKFVNEIGTFQQQYYISNNHAVWDYSTIYYGLHTDRGLVFAKATYDNRLNRQGVQGEFEAYPIINKFVYLDLDFAFANQPNLFPNKAYALEAYVSGNAFDYSIGAKYNDVDKNHHFSVFTGNLAKQFANNRVLFRPYYFYPGKGRDSQLYTVDLRHIILDPYFYFGCIFGTGTSPDLANLETVNFIVVENELINPYINFPLFNDRLIVFLSALVQNQIFKKPESFIRNWYGGTIGLNWKF